MVSSAQNKLKNRPETTAAIATTHKLTKKDDTDSTKTIAVTTNNQVRQRRGNDRQANKRDAGTGDNERRTRTRRKERKKKKKL